MGSAQILEQNHCLNIWMSRQGKEGGQAAGWAGGALLVPGPAPAPHVGTSPQAVSFSEISQMGSPQGLGTDPWGRGGAAN